MAWSTTEKVASGITLSNSNKTATSNGSGNQRVHGDTYHNTGKYYCEIQGWAGSGGGIGLSTVLAPLNGNGFTYNYGIDTGGNVHIQWDGSGSGNPGSPGTHTVCIAVDFTNNRLWFRIDAGNWNGSGTADPATNVGGASITGHPALVPEVAFFGTTDHATLATTAADFLQTKPSGFSEWDTAEANNNAYMIGFDSSKATSQTAFAFSAIQGLTDDIAIVTVVSEPNSTTANDVTSVTDASGLTWTLFTKQVITNHAGTSKMNLEVWWAALTSNLVTPQNVTVHWGTAIDSVSCGLIMVRNVVSPTVPFDAASPAFNSNTSGSSVTPTVPLSTDGEAVAFAIYGSLDANFAATAGSGASGSPNFQFQNNNSGNQPAFMWMLVQDPSPTTSETSHSIAMPSGETNWGMLGFALAGPTNTGGIGVSGTWASTEAIDTMLGFGVVPCAGPWASTEAPDTWATSSGFERLDVENFVDSSGSGTITLSTNGPDRILVYMEAGVAVTGQANLITSITDSAGLTWQPHLGLVAGEDTNNDNIKIEIWWAYAHDKLASNTLSVTSGSGGTTTGAGVGFAVKGMNGNYNYPFDNHENAFSLGAAIGSYFGADSVPTSVQRYADGPMESASGGTPIFTSPFDADCTITGSGLTLTGTAAGGFAYLSPSANGVLGGRYYFEVTFTTIMGGSYGAGFFYWPSGALSTLFSDGAGGFTVRGDGTIWTGSDIGNLGVTPANGDVIGIALDFDNGLAWAKDITQSGNWNGDVRADPSHGAGGIGIPVVTDSLSHSFVTSNLGGYQNTAVAFGSVDGNGAVMHYAFAVTPPSGFLDWPGAFNTGTAGPFPAIRVAMTISITPTLFGVLDALNGVWVIDVSNGRTGSQRNMSYVVQHELLGTNILLTDNDILHGTTAAPAWSMIYTTFVPGATDPGSWVSIEATDTCNFHGYTGAFGIVGDLTTTEAPDIAAIFGFERDSGVWASTEAKDIFGAAGRVPLVGHFIATEAPDIFAAVGVGRGENGVWISTEGVDIFSASGHTPITAILDATEVTDRFVAIGAGVTQSSRRRQLIVT